MSPYHSNANPHPFPGTYVKRVENPELPETVSLLTTEEGCKMYVVGTAHFSESSQEDVIKVGVKNKSLLVFGISMFPVTQAQFQIPG